MILETQPKYEQALLATLIHIETHLEDDLTLEGLARRAGFSPYHFHRLFRAIVGEPVKEYIRRLRLDRSAYRLKISEETILQIALAAGFKTHASFTRAFKRQFGTTPQDFRRDFLRTSPARKSRPRPQYPADHHMSDNTGLLANGSTAARVRLEHVRPIVVAFVRHTGPYDGLLEPGTPLSLLWDELFAWGSANRSTNAGSLLIGIPQDDPSITPPEKLRFDVCVQIPAARPTTGHIGCQTIPPGLYGAGRHYGSFDDLADTYAHIYRTLVADGKYRLRPGTPFEVYSHTQVKDDLRIHFTDVYLPVEQVERNRQAEEGTNEG